MKSTLMIVYLCCGMVVCLWFTAAAAFGWQSPDFGVVKALNSGSGRSGYYGGGRSYGGSWGGGK